MKKIYMICIALSVCGLSGCFWQKDTVSQPEPIVVQPVPPTPIPTDTLSGEAENTTGVNDDNRADELDENGEFDPTKFSDEDVNEIMELMKELIGE